MLEKKKKIKLSKFQIKSPTEKKKKKNEIKSKKIKGEKIEKEIKKTEKVFKSRIKKQKRKRKDKNQNNNENNDDEFVSIKETKLPSNNINNKIMIYQPPQQMP